MPESICNACHSNHPVDRHFRVSESSARRCETGLHFRDRGRQERRDKQGGQFSNRAHSRSIDRRSPPSKPWRDGCLRDEGCKSLADGGFCAHANLAQQGAGHRLKLAERKWRWVRSRERSFLLWTCSADVCFGAQFLRDNAAVDARGRPVECIRSIGDT